METKTYVIGHKNPDTDSIAAAIAYAELRRRCGESGVVAAAAGEPNPQTSFILGRLSIEPPPVLHDARPRVRDVLSRQPVTVGSETPLMRALDLLHKNNIRVLPVVDDGGCPSGLVSLLRLSEGYLFAGKERARQITTSLDALASCLDGRFLAGEASKERETLKLFIGAMLEESFSARIDGHPPENLLIVTGDRRTIQQAAIERGVRLLVVTGGHTVADDLLEKAGQNGVAVLSTPHDTATAAWLARLSIPVGLFIEESFERIGTAEPLEHLRLKLLHGKEPAVLAVEEDGRLAGVATKSTLLAPVPYSLVLVDHNELSQAVPGAESLEILEIIDHHKLGNIHTSQPISFVTAPVGSTCTLVAHRWRERGMEPDQRTAALLLAGILSDTVILKSPTTTARDRETAGFLAKLAELDVDEFGKEIFSAAGGFSAYDDPEKAVTSDFKHFSAGGVGFGIGQVEVFGFDEFHELKETLRTALAAVRRRENLALAGLMVTDIRSETTLFLADGMGELVHVMDYPQVEPHIYEMRGVMSRKKQMVPHLMSVLARLGTA